MSSAFRTFLSKSGTLLMSQQLVRKSFPFLPLYNALQKNVETQKENIYVVVVFEHCFSIKRDQKSSSNACGVLNFKV